MQEKYRNTDFYYVESEKEYIAAAKNDGTFDQVKKWITENVLPFKNSGGTLNYRFTSYTLKHIIEQELNIYVNNGTVKEIMKALDINCTLDHNPCYAVDNCFYKFFTKKQNK